MKRYSLLFLIALFVCVPAMAQEDVVWWAGSQYQYITQYVQPQVDQNGDRETLAQVESRYEQMLRDSMSGYGNQVKNFGASYINGYNSEAGQGLVTGVNQYVNEYSPSRSTEFNINEMNTAVNQYINTATAYASQITATMNANSNGYSKINDVKQAYGDNMRDIVQYFMEDVKNRNLFDMADYEKDFQLIQKFVNDRLSRDQIQSQGTRHKFNPMDYVDRGLPDKTRDRVEVKVQHAGVNNQYVNMSTRNLIDKVNNEFGRPRDLDNEVGDNGWFTANWNNEMNVTMSQVNTRVNDLYEVHTGGRETNVNLTMNVNEYGNITNHGEGLRDDTPVTETHTLLDNIYNNRRYHFRDGTYNTVSVTVGGRKYQLYDQFYTSPLVLDLDGDGKLEASKGEWMPHKYNDAKLVEFDIDGDQFLELTEWVGSNDGLLLVGYEKGKEINANHMFGEAGGYKNGFEKLSLFDTNGDKKVSGDELKTLSVWQDRNGNAKVDDGEVVAVADLGITEISLTYEQMVASFVQKGETRKVWDWWPTYFRIKKTR